MLRAVVLLIAGGVSLYVVLPGLVAVFGSWRSLTRLAWPFAALAVGCGIASLVGLWQLDRIALRVSGWFAVATTQLSGNAVGRLLPGGGATATAVTVRMLRQAGVDPGAATAGLAASIGLQVATALALPIFALPAIIAGAPLSHGLATAALLGAVSLLLLVAIGTVVLAADVPLELAAAAIARLLNATVCRPRPVAGLPGRLLAARDRIRGILGRRWRAVVVAAVANTGFDYLFALRAVGADPRPSLVLLAYAAVEVLTLVPLTPGGLGFVEAGLVATLTLAGVPGPQAIAATLFYRLVSFWSPLPAGGVAYLLFRRRYG